MVNRQLIYGLIAAGIAAACYRVYNLDQYKRYSAEKLKKEKEAKEKAEYYEFIKERRHRRFWQMESVSPRLSALQNIVACGICFLAGFLIGEGKRTLEDAPSA